MISFRYLQTSLMVGLTPLLLANDAFAGETHSASQGSLHTRSDAGTSAALQAEVNSVTRSETSNHSQARSAGASEAASQSRPLVVTGGPAVKDTVKLEPSHRSVGSNKRRAAHWKTRYWNQNTTRKTQ